MQLIWRHLLLKQTKTVFDMIAEHQNQVAELKGIKPQDDDWLCLQYQRAKAALQDRKSVV